MPKLPHQSTVPPVDGLDSATRDYADTSGGGGAGSGSNLVSALFTAASQQRLSITDGAQSELALTVDLTFELWVKFNTIGAIQTFVSKLDLGAADDSYRFRIDASNNLELTISSDGSTDDSVTQAWTPSTGIWYHLAVTRDDALGEVRFYVNAAQLGSPQTLTTASGMFDSTADFTVGGGYGINQHFLDGQVSEVRVWNVPRTAQQIADNYRRLLNGDEAGLVGYWRLDAGFSDVTANSNDLVDTSVTPPITFVRDVPFGGAADMLVSTGGIVDLKDAPAPATGQILTATSSTTAEWTDPPAGGGTPGPSQDSAYVSSGNYFERTTGVDGVLDGMLDLTVEAWVKPDALVSWGTFVSKGSTSQPDCAWRFRFGSGGTSVEFILYAPDGVTSTTLNRTPSTAFAGGEWRHLAFTRNGTTGVTKLYVDGAQEGADGSSAAAVNVHTATGIPFRIGRTGGGVEHPYTGRVAEVRVWEVERTAAQISNYMTKKVSPGAAGLVGYYPLDNEILDLSQSELDLSSVGSPTFAEEVPAGNPASSFVHNTGNVAVQGGLPAIGQALVATSPSTAEWSDVATQSVVAAAEGAYIHAALSAAQVDPSVNDAVAFDTAVTSRGELAVDGAGKFSGLKAGRTYVLTGSARIVGGGDVTMGTAWYNVTAASEIGTRSGQITPISGSAVSNQSAAYAIITPLVDTEVELRVTNIFNLPDVNDVDSFASIIEVGAVQANVIGGMEFMDSIEVTGSAVTSVDFGDVGDGIFQRALDSDVDDHYVLIGMVKNATASPIGIDVYPDGSAMTDGDGSRLATSTDGVAPGTNDEPTGRVAVVPGLSGTWSSFRADFFAPAGGPRQYLSQCVLRNTATEAYFNQFYGTSDDSAVFTSLRIIASAASAMDVGSKFYLYRVSRNNVRADSAAVYERMALETVDPGALVTTERTLGQTIYGGSVVGVSARVEDAVTAGSITCNVKVDGVTTLTAVLDTTNTTSHVVREAIGVHTFAADKNVSVEFVPSGYDNVGSVASPVTVQVHLTNDALIAAGGSGGGGYSGTWSAQTYSSGSIVRAGPFVFGATADTAVEPCIVEGDLGNSSDWNPLGNASQTGKTLVLVNNLTTQNSAAVRQSINSGWDQKRLIIDALVGPNGGADAIQFGILDSSVGISPTPSSGMEAVTGFYGVTVDIWNNQVEVVSNGVAGATSAYNTSFADGVYQIEVTRYYRYILDMVDVGANWTINLYRDAYDGGTGTGDHSRDNPGFIATWTVTKPSFTDWRFALGGWSGGVASVLKVRNAYVMDRSGDWDVISVLPHMPRIDSGVWE